MAKILIKTGEFEGQCWRLEGDKLTHGFYKVKELPIPELLFLTKKQQLNNLLYAEFRFSNHITFTASMTLELFDEIQIIMKESKIPRKSDIPLDSGPVAREEPETQQQQAWKNGKVIAQRSEENILQVLGWVIFIALFTYGVKNSDLNPRATLAYQQACMTSVNALTGYEESSLKAEGKEITYQSNNGDAFTFRCSEDKVQFYAESTGQWVNMIP